ncbi:MAG: MucR family transcriptional regulator [Thermodesulfobacteriota bacterium]
MSKSLLEMAADIVKSQAQATVMSTEEVTQALQSTFTSLQSLQSMEANAEMGAASDKEAPAVDIKPERSILKNKIICLECGESFKMLSPKHLRSHGLDGRSYRKKYGLPLRQALCAKSLSDRRKKAGKERGLPDNLRKSIEARSKAGAKKKTTRAKKKK